MAKKASSGPTFNDIKQQIATGNLAPVYLLHGKESYYLDVLAKEFERVIPDNDKEFNQYILYAPQVEPGAVIDLCYRFPMMAERQVVILKEAQAARADQINKLYKYVDNPSRSTVLVIIFRGDDGKGKDLMASAKKNAVVFHSPEIRDYQMKPLIAQYIQSKGMTTDDKSIAMLTDYIGANLSAVANQIDKLHTILGTGARITPEAIERNIGISKEYNSFELVDALARKDLNKAFKIADVFASNPKANPLPPVAASLFTYFSNLTIAIFAPDKSDANLISALGFKSTFQLNNIRMGMRCYNAYQVIEVIWALRKFDVQSKGGGSRQDPYALFHDLLFHIVTAPGNLGI